jgi:hypothetical protein
VSAIVSSHRVFDGANHGAPAMYSGASGCSSMQMGPEGLLIKCGFGYSDVSRCIYAPGSSTPASPSGSSPRLRPHRAPVHPELTSHGVHADALCAGCSHSVHFLVGQACSRSFLWFRRRADQRVVGLAVGLCIRANPLIPRGNQPLDPRSPVPTTLHCFHKRWKTRTRFLSGSSSVCERGSRTPVGFWAHMGERSEPMGSPLGSTTFQQFKALTGRVTIDNVADPGLRGGSVGERLMSATRHP